MKNIWDCREIRIRDIIGAVAHHEYFTANKKVSDDIRRDSEFIGQHGVEAYLNREYRNPGDMTKNIIVNKISGRLYMTDGNKHSVALVIAKPEITVGDLLDIEPKLFRYWEEGYEEGADMRYQPYDTYIPGAVGVEQVTGARQGVDDKGNRVNIIMSNIPYNSVVFRKKDRGKPIMVTAYRLEEENAYSALEQEIESEKEISMVLGGCVRAYERISKINVKYGLRIGTSGYDDILIWSIAGRVMTMNIADRDLKEELSRKKKNELAREIFPEIDRWVKGENGCT